MLTRLTYRLGQLLSIVGAGLVALAALALLVTVGRAVWWLCTDHPAIAIIATLAGALWAILINAGNSREQL